MSIILCKGKELKQLSLPPSLPPPARPLPVVPQRRERRADGEPQVPGGERGRVRADDAHAALRRQRGPLLPGRHLRAHHRHDLQHGRGARHLLS